MSESIQKVLTRRRPPRVKITYDVETGGAMEKRELPFIVGIFADLSGDAPAEPVPAVKERKMVEIDQDSFNDVMKSCKPGSNLQYTLDGQKYRARLQFNKLEDFEPVRVIDGVSEMKGLFQQRAGLRDMQSRLESDEQVELAVEALLSDAGGAARSKLVELFPALGSAGAPSAPASAEDVESSEEGEAAAEADEPDSNVPAETGAPQQVVTEDSWKAVTLAQLKPAFKSLEAMAALFASLKASVAQDPVRLETFNVALGYFTNEILVGWDSNTGSQVSISHQMDAAVARIDTLLSRHLSAVMQHENFQALEASWRGLHHLVHRSETGRTLKLRVMNITRDELQADLDKAVEFDQSHIFKLIYEAEYGTYGGAPYSLLLGDYSFGRMPKDIALLKKIAEVAAAAHAPFLAAVNEDMFGLKSFDTLGKPRDLAKIFESAELNGWRSFREHTDSRYIALTMPRVMLRLPYGEKRLVAQGVRYEEQVVVPVDKSAEQLLIDDNYEEWRGEVDSNRCLWGNPAWFLAERITNAFTQFGWTAAIRGVEGGGLLEGLPNLTYLSAEGDIGLQCPTQVSITDRREKELNDLGFIAACHCKGSNKAAFFGGQTTNQPIRYLADAANSNAQLSSMLPYMLAASRFAHYVKVIMRDKIGSFMTRANVERYLNEWIAQYILLDDDATQEIKASYPLREARVDVTAVPGRPGVYNATMFLKPHFQLEELTTSIRLVAELPS